MIRKAGVPSIFYGSTPVQVDGRLGGRSRGGWRLACHPDSGNDRVTDGRGPAALGEGQYRRGWRDRSRSRTVANMSTLRVKLQLYTVELLVNHRSETVCLYLVGAECGVRTQSGWRMPTIS